jgi:DNA-binding protein HU-beta
MMTGRLHGRSRLGKPPAKKTTPVTRESAAPAKSAVQATITLKHLAAELAEGHDLAKKQAEAVLGDLVTLTTKHLKKGDKSRLNGLGILQVRKRAARIVASRRGRPSPAAFNTRSAT